MARILTYHKDMAMIDELIAKDKHLEVLFETVKSVSVTLSDDYFLALVSAILAQQLSGRVAQVIYNRVATFYEQEITPHKILETEDEKLRELGLSYRKVSYLKSLATSIVGKIINVDEFKAMDNQSIIDKLIQVKGIGPWTAQMFLMFSLGREDVSAPLDLGLRKAYSKLIGYDVSVREYAKMSDAWKPYRTIVAHFLWHLADNQLEDLK